MFWALLLMVLLAILAAGVVSFRRRTEDRPYAWVWWLPIAYLTFMGTVGLAYQGYQEDDGSHPAQTWPLAAISFPLAALMTWTALRRRPPGRIHFSLIILALAANLALTWNRPLHHWAGLG